MKRIIFPIAAAAVIAAACTEAPKQPELTPTQKYIALLDSVSTRMEQAQSLDDLQAINDEFNDRIDSLLTDAESSTATEKEQAQLEEAFDHLMKVATEKSLQLGTGEE